MVGKSKNFTDLVVWRKSHQFVLEIYKMSSKLPTSETFGIVSQIRRASVSIPANIAEGFKRRGNSDKAKFYNIAQCSLEEARYYLILITDLYKEDVGELTLLAEEISKLLYTYRKSIITSDY